MSAFSHFVHLPTGHVVLENPFDPKLAPRPIVAHYTKPMNGLAPIDQPSCLHLYRDYLPRPFPSSLLDCPFVVLNRRPHGLALDIFPNWTEAQYREALSFGLLGPQPFNITQDPQPFQVFSQEWGWPHRGVLLSLVGLEIIRQTQAQPSVLLFADPFGEWLFYLTQARTWYSCPSTAGKLCRMCQIR